MRTTTSTTRVLAAAALTALVATGCSGDGDDTAAPPPSPAGSPTSDSSPSPARSPAPSPDEGAQWATCLNDRSEVTLQVSHPEGWTVRDHPDGGCSYFDPEPFEIERGTEVSGVAIRLDIEPTTYDRIRDAYLRDGVRSQRETEVAGFPALRIEDEHTSGPSGPKGERLTYLADLGSEQTLVLTTNETDAGDPMAARQVLDEMAVRMSRAS